MHDHKDTTMVHLPNGAYARADTIPSFIPTNDIINNPVHYTTHPSGVECIDVIEHMPFNIGAAVKYLWRCDIKDSPEENLNKALWYIRREIKKRKFVEISRV